MNSSSSQKRLMTQYLLGELSAEERNNFEEQFSADRDLFEELVAVENDMVDAYASGTLMESERTQFESRYLATPKHRGRATFARSLRDYFSAEEPATSIQNHQEWVPRDWSAMPVFTAAQSNILKIAAAIVFVATVTVSLWALMINRRLHHEFEALQAEQTNLQRQEKELQQQIAELSARLQDAGVGNGQQQQSAQTWPPGPGVASLTLMAEVRSGDDQNTLILRNGVSTVLLRLKLDRREYLNYRVSLATAEGTSIWQKQDLKSQSNLGPGKAILAEVPSRLLKRGDYILKLSGTATGGKEQEVAAYTFRVVER